MNEQTINKIKRLLDARRALVELHTSYRDTSGLELAFEYEKQAKNLWRSMGGEECSVAELTMLVNSYGNL